MSPQDSNDTGSAGGSPPEAPSGGAATPLEALAPTGTAVKPPPTPLDALATKGAITQTSIEPPIVAI